MDDKITIIEGPPPIFETVNDAWAMGVNEGPDHVISLLTRLRTYNGPALVERCYRAWHNRSAIHLHYRNDQGIEQSAPIHAARNVETADGHMLLLWLNFNREKVELEYDSNEDDSAEDGLE